MGFVARGVLLDTRNTLHARVKPAELLAVLLCTVGSSIAISWLMGRDLNWDYFNYHAYAAHQALGGGQQDFFAAGYQGYLNPAPYLPFAWMEAAGWHSLAIGSALAAFHALNVFFLYLIAREVTVGSRRPRSSAAVVTLLGAASAPYLCQVGSTFADVTTTVPVMAAVWLSVARPSLRGGLLAAMLVGAAVALKWTNAPYALALLLAQATTLWCASWGRTIRRWLALAGAMAIGFIAFYAAWGWRLWREFGSPVFPLFNQIFRAPDASIEPIALDRFVPQTWGELLSLPWRMMALEGWVYTEPPAPDLRPVVFLLLLLVVAVVGLWRRHAKAGEPGPDERAKRVVLPLFFVVALAAWLATSANGRYAIPLLLLLGPLIYRAAATVIPDGGARILVLVLALLQAAHVANAGNPRWAPQAWAPTWLPAEVPESVRTEPALYVLVGRSSESYLARYAHPDSVFTNPIGLISIATGGPGWDRFVELRERHRGRTRVVMAGGSRRTVDRTSEALQVHDELIDRLGLKLVPGRCEAAQFNVDSQTLGPWHLEPDELSRRRGLLICDAVPKLEPDALLAERRALAERIMDAYEATCPRYFSPRGAQTEGTRGLWTRLYGRFDLYLMIDWENEAILYRQDRQATPVLIGTLKTWEEDVRRFQCRRPHDGSRGIATLVVGPPAQR